MTINPTATWAFFILGDALVKQHTVSYITVNDINTDAPVTIVSNANDESEFFLHGINFSNSRLQGSSSCALSVTVTQLCLIYSLCYGDL